MDELEEVLGLPRPKRQAGEIAILGDREDDLTIAGGYLQVAELAARHWIEHGPDNRLPIPILYNYRHGIELTLKWLIRLTARCLVRDGYVQEDLSSARLDEKLHTHNIKKLSDRLDRYLGLLHLDAPDDRIDNASRQLLEWLDSEDQTGEAFRYAVVGHGPTSVAARPNQVSINFYEQVNELHQLANLLYDGYSSFLDDHERMQIDYYADLDSQGPLSSTVARAWKTGRMLHGRACLTERFRRKRQSGYVLRPTNGPRGMP